MSWLIAIIVGGLVGWVAYLVTRSRISMFWSVIVGAIGGVLANTGTFFGITGLAAVTLSALGIVTGIVGAIIALVVVEGIAMVAQEREMPGKAYHEEIRDREKKDREK